MAAAPSSVYWVGQDGNTYVNAAGVAGGVQNMGAANYPGSLANQYSAAKGSGAATRIDDPNAPKAPVQSNVGSLSGSATISPNPGQTSNAPVYQDNSNDIAVQNAGLGAVDGQTNAGIAAINAALGNILGGYGKETAANEGNYTNESNSNMNSLQGGKQTALVNAAQGRQGLLGTLASIGALSGDSINLANQAVQHGANTDLAGVNNTFGTNQTALDGAIGTYRRENQNRIDTANTETQNSIKSERAKAAQTKQKFLTNLVSDYQGEGKAAQGKTYADQAAALYPEIAANNVPSGAIAPQSAAYTAPTLSTYLGGNNTAVQTTPAAGKTPGTLPGLSALSGKKQQASVMVA